MEVVIDGHKVDTAENAAIDKVKLYEAVKTYYGGNTRIIVTAKINGQEYDFSRTDLDFGPGSKTIELLTATPREIAAAGVYDAIIMLENAKLAIKTASERILLGDYESGMAKFGEAVRGLQWVVSLVTTVREAGVANFSDEKPYTAEFVTNTGVFNDLLTTIERFINSKDTVMISDTLEYELAPVIERWQQSLPNLYTDIVEGSTLH